MLTIEAPQSSRRLRPYANLGLVALLFSLPLVFLYYHFDLRNTQALQTYAHETTGAHLLEKFILNTPKTDSADQLAEFLRSETSVLNEVHDFLEASSLAKDLPFPEDRLETPTAQAQVAQQELQNVLQFSGALRESILDRSALILDPDLAPFWLMEIHFNSLPKIRDEIIGSYARSLTQEDKIQLTKNPYIDRNFLKYDRHINMLESLIQTGGFAWPQSLSSYRAEYQILKDALNSLYADPSPIAYATFFKAYQNYERSGLELFLNINNIRIEKLKTFSKMSGVGAFGLWFLAALLVLYFSRFISRTELLFKLRIQNQANAIEKASTLSTLGEFASGIGHEINNYLTVLLASNSILARELKKTNSPLLKQTDRIHKMGERINSIMRSMKSVIHKDGTLHLQHVVIKSVIDEVRTISQTRLNELGIELVLNSISDDATVLASEAELAQVLMNLISNACDAVAATPVKRIEITCEKRGPSWVLAVQDSGPGVPAENRDKIFESLFTTKPHGQGTGLGLSISSQIMKKFGGTLSLAESPAGARFEVSFQDR